MYEKTNGMINNLKNNTIWKIYKQQMVWISHSPEVKSNICLF